MSRKIIIAGNWKMNKTASEGKVLAEQLLPLVKDINEVDIAVCVPFTTIHTVVKYLEGSNIKVGAQNIHWAQSGAYTGEISAAMLKEEGVEFVIIGHSERRQYFGETDETVNQRLRAALDADLKPIVCIGELLEEREGGKTEEVLDKQITIGFKDISKEEMAKTVIAYEPVWAIGTGKTATPDMAEETHAYIRKKIADMFDTATADAVRIQYGGSMKPENAADLLKQSDIDGGLIGGASLKADAFSEIVKKAL